MDADALTSNHCDVLVGYDASPSAAAAIEYGARLLPDAAVRIVHLWAPAFTNVEVRRRVWRRARSLEQLQTLLEQEAAADASGSRGKASHPRRRRDGRPSR